MKVFICLLLIGLLYLGFSAGNRTWDMFTWNTDSIALFTILSIFIVLIPIYFSYMHGDYYKKKEYIDYDYTKLK